MKRVSPIALALLVSCAGGAPQGTGPLKITHAADLTWEAAPGLAGGMQTALQYGDPKVGPYHALIRFPAGMVVQPHYHKVDEFATVVSGAVLFGTGETIDESKAVKIEAGGTLNVPAGVAHWAKAVSEAVIARWAPGPRELTPCSPERPAPNRAAAVKGLAAKDLPWVDVPNLAKGARRADSWGDPKTGPNVFHVAFPAGITRPPHTHSADECMTILSGSLLMGEGPKVDESKAVKVSAGATVIVPAGAAHWLVTKEAVVFSVAQPGARDIKFLEPPK
jgi:quercetin dioxygenase-like cupin family protein